MRRTLYLCLLAGCTDPADLAVPIHAPDGADFWDTPWPSDTRRDADGTLDVADFPNPYGVQLLESYKAFADGFEGFGTTAPIYVSFASAPDPLLLPTPAESVVPGASVMLVCVDPGSRCVGEQVPIQWEIREGEGSAYVPDHQLAVAPVFGFALRPRTQYALVLTTDAAAPAPGFAGVWSTDHPDHTTYANLLDTLPFLGLGPDDVAIATAFTTRDPVDEMARLTWFIRERLELPDLNLQLEYLESFTHYDAYRTHYPGPVFTHGDRPYSELGSGGGFRFEEDGTPKVSMWDDMRLSVCAPADRSDPPETGWPVVIYQHGTGGHYRGFCNGDGALEVANQLGAAGLIGVGIDQPLHGPRGQGSDLDNFNFFNPESGVSNFRQGALDAVYLAHALADRQWKLKLPEGGRLKLDPDRVLFMGHSQGGITGALAAPFFGGDVQAAMLSGAGGVLAITIVERDDIIDFEAMVKSVLTIEEDEILTPLYPVIGLIQIAVEPTDPVNYSPYFHAERGDWDHQVPIPVLLTSGTLDTATPYRTAVALAGAGEMPLLYPQITSTPAHTLRGIAARPGPLVDNVRAWDDSRVTSAFSQWRDGSHWVVFEEAAAADVYRTFLRTAADGTAIAVRD